MTSVCMGMRQLILVCCLQGAGFAALCVVHEQLRATLFDEVEPLCHFTCSQQGLARFDLAEAGVRLAGSNPRVGESTWLPTSGRVSQPSSAQPNQQPQVRQPQRQQGAGRRWHVQGGRGPCSSMGLADCSQPVHRITQGCPSQTSW
jgi:hypothetical protein